MRKVPIVPGNYVYWREPERPDDLTETAWRKLKHDDYLSSSHWQAKREQVFARHGRICRACRATDDLQVHHLSYDRFGREPLTDLMVLCAPCHLAVTRLVYVLNPSNPGSRHGLDISSITNLAIVVIQARLSTEGG